MIYDQTARGRVLPPFRSGWNTCMAGIPTKDHALTGGVTVNLPAMVLML